MRVYAARSRTRTAAPAIARAHAAPPSLALLRTGCGRTEKVEDSLVWFGTGNMRWVHGMTGKVADQYAAPLDHPLPRRCPRAAALRVAC